ncbi:MAG: ferritin-like domain-containing protein [Desulfohalobiaceae bacterium]|nr:ferritin-like domain-containing protein [Desulfohalobiaceae bacterium]
MRTNELIDMLNRDLREEHAAVLRYLIHSYTEGEDTPMGAKLLTRAREEMWHMHWLGAILGRLDGEPELSPAEYPYDPSSRGRILQSYVTYEQNLVPHYNSEAEKVEDPHIKRVLEREAWESDFHAKAFQRMLDRLDTTEADSLPEAEADLPREFLDTLQREVAAKYTEMLEHIRHSWILPGGSSLGWGLMDQAMEKMRHLAHFAEDVVENGAEPDFSGGDYSRSSDPATALRTSLKRLQEARERHRELRAEEETGKHAGLVLNLDLTLKQEQFQEAEIGDWLRKI